MSDESTTDVPRNNPPHNRTILFYAVLSVALLGLLKPAFDSYYDVMVTGTRAEMLETYSDLRGLDAAQATWNEGLTTGRMPIGRAMSELAERGRTAFPQIRPEAGESMNLDPLRGWAQLPQEVTVPAPEPEPEPEVVPVPEGALDEGATDTGAADTGAAAELEENQQ